MPNECLLILDEYSGQKDDEIFQLEDERFSNKILSRLTIPAGTTGILQPLDKGCFRFAKGFARHIHHHVILENIEINLKDRNIIQKTKSLIFSQLASRKFRSFFVHAWDALENIKTDFSPNNFLKNFFDISDLSCALCSKSPFIKCAYDHCKKTLCFEHFFIDYHYHSYQIFFKTLNLLYLSC